MINVINNEVVVKQDSNKEYSKFLWEVIDLMSNRFTIVAFNKKKSKFSNEKSEKMKFGSDEIILMQCDSNADYVKAINGLSDSLIFDFYITINSSLKTIKSMIEENGDFNVDWFLGKFPKTLHIEEDGFKIDLETFSNYAFQIERIVKRFNQ
ncbi:MAG: hypothetical protein PHN56_06005 [Candidatus Nanoarchaeia archaeon]|nr:hypothetical protein [Candidatus Nanoarchaeia archaeon]